MLDAAENDRSRGDRTQLKLKSITCKMERRTENARRKMEVKTSIKV